MNTRIESTDNILELSFPDGRAEQLHMFFEKIWMSRSTYKVLMARRAFNLNYIFMSRYNAFFTEEYRLDNIISNNALILESEELALHYARFGIFPDILICDDILLHGRTIMRLISRLRDGIMSYIYAYDMENEKDNVERALYNAIHIYVYTINEGGSLLDDRFRLTVEEPMPISGIRELSQQISDCILSCGIANTSYIISSELSHRTLDMLFSFVRPNSENYFSYRGRHQLVDISYEKNIIRTVRIRRPQEFSNYGGIVTSLVLFGHLDKYYLDELCLRTALWFNDHIVSGRISEILEYGYAESDCSRMQMLNCLLSVFNLAEYGREVLKFNNNEVYHLLMMSDYNKISANFDFSFIIEDELEFLFSAISFDGLSGKWLFDYISAHSTFIDKKSDRNMQSSSDQDKDIYEHAEDIFYQKGIDAEEEAFSIRVQNRRYDTNVRTADSMTLTEYRSRMNLLGESDDKKNIGCVLCLMDSGLVSMNIEPSDNGYETVLKAGELATSVYVRRYSVFVPALAVVERNFLKKGMFKIAIVSSFIDYLHDHCYSQYGDIEIDDRNLLNEFEADKSKLLEIYRGGQNFEDWDADIITFGDRIRTNGRRSEWHLSKEEEYRRKIYYVRCAIMFLNNNSVDRNGTTT